MVKAISNCITCFVEHGSTSTTAVTACLTHPARPHMQEPLSTLLPPPRCTHNIQTADGARLFVAEHGQADGPPLLLLHGGLGSLHDFDAITAGLPQNARLLLADLRGQGRSSMGQIPLSYAQYECDALAVLDGLGIARAGVLGLSDGGITGYRLAAHHRERVILLLTIGAQWRLNGADDPSLPLLGGLHREQWAQMFPDSVAHYESHNPAPDFDALLAQVKAMWLSAEGYPGESMVRRIAVPTLIVRGDTDPFLCLDDAHALCEHIGAGAGLLNLPFCSHAAHEEKPAAFLATVNPFLRQHLGLSPTVPTLRPCST